MWKDRDKHQVFPPVEPPPTVAVSEWSDRDVSPTVTAQFPTRRLNAHQLEQLGTALEILQSIFPYCDINIESRIEEDKPRSNRDKVLAITKQAPATVEYIAKMTGLDHKQIRGVLSAADLKFTTTVEGRMVAYKFAGARERAKGASANRMADETKDDP